MSKILVFGGSNSKHSINKQLAIYASNQVTASQITIIDLNDFEMPLYGIDKEMDSGIPAKATLFSSMVAEHDAIILSLAEHNGSYTVAFKNIVDWVSRIPNQKIWQGKKILLLSTSPGGRGGASVMATALKTMPYQGAEIVANFSLPSFKKNFSEEGISDAELKAAFEKVVDTFQSALG